MVICLNDLGIAPVARKECRQIRITHPFHPLHGRHFELIEHRFIFTESYLYFHDDSGHLREIPAVWTLDAMPAGGIEPKQFLTFNDTVSKFTPPPALAKKTGTCTVNIGDFGATFVAANGQRNSTLTVEVTEPGCDASQILKETLPDGLEVTTTAIWKPTGAKVPVRLSIAPKKP